jgi:hypothetical protein
VNRLVDICLKKKLNSNEQKISLNKALLFVVSEFDRVRETGAYHELALTQLIIKKFSRRINKEALRRVFAFFRSKYDDISEVSEENVKHISNMVNFLERLCKEDKNVTKDEEE